MAERFGKINGNDLQTVLDITQISINFFLFIKAKVDLEFFPQTCDKFYGNAHAALCW